ncbi:hypothetical protein BMAFMH_G0118, partial [Burkholderia mallei FMH]
ACGARRTHA